MINVDSRVDNECPPNQNGDIDWPLGQMTDEGNSEYHNHKQRGDSGPAWTGPLARSRKGSRRGLANGAVGTFSVASVRIKSDQFICHRRSSFRGGKRRPPARGAPLTLGIEASFECSGEDCQNPSPIVESILYRIVHSGRTTRRLSRGRGGR
jgi:hypothetical protein